MSEKAIFFIHALTSMHPGSGTALGAVDLPIQRERHTGWPIIPASSQKGVLRDVCTRKSGNSKKISAVFGPDTNGSNDHAGALGLTDARILAFPVRSLKGVFAWVTCHSVLDRLRRDSLLAEAVSPCPTTPQVAEEKVLCAEGSPLLLDDGGKLILEEYEFTRTADADAVANWIASRVTQDTGVQDHLKKCLVILNDDDFSHFARHATEVVARIGLDHFTKSVKKGALFYQEFLPPETLFYSLVFAEDSRNMNKKNMKANDILSYVAQKLPPYLQIGGGETIGKGMCAVRLVDKEGNPFRCGQPAQGKEAA